MTLPPWIGTWSRPPDLASKLALGAAVLVALVAIAGRGRSMLVAEGGAKGARSDALPRKTFFWVTAFSAAMLSVFYIAEYLRGGPRIVDATTYFLQGRALSEGFLAWPAQDPATSFTGRFLIHHDGTIGGIFPPGYPLLLAVGFTVGAPMIIGPVLAALLVLSTYRLAKTLAKGTVSDALVEPVGRGAAIFSVVCAALRYHTADTMSHGAAALGVTLALDAALRARRSASALDDARARRFALLAGLAIGFVVATRPVSALPIGLVALFVVRGRRDLLARVALGLVPGVLLLLLSQHAVTGSWLASTQRMYYANSDGPPGCFRWGFGKDTGCIVEHGDFVESRLARGYFPKEALGTTLRRLKMHLLDVLDLEPLALLVLLPLVQRPRRTGAVAALALFGLQVLAYAPFYFDGNYPGGGARFFADVIPAEHALVALALGAFASRLAADEARVRRFARALYATVALALAGFAVHAVFDHIQLRDRDGGRPMFEPDVLVNAHATAGLVFVDTDHGFSLAHDPGARPQTRAVVARLRDDARDRLLYDRLDRPPTWIYRFEVPAPPAKGEPPKEATPVVVAWAPPPIQDDTWKFEAEGEWPALAQHGGFAATEGGPPCASRAWGLFVVPTPAAGTAEVTVDVPVPETGRWSVALRVVPNARYPHTPQAAPGTSGEMRIGGASVTWTAAGAGSACVDVPAREVELTAPSAPMVLVAKGGTVFVDTITLKRVPPQK